MTAVQPGRLPRAAAPVTGSLRTGARDAAHPATRGPAVLSYYLVGGATLLLLAIGVVMVLSASSITSIRETGSPYGFFLDQAVFALVGIPLMVVASRVPVAWYRRLAWPALGLGLLLQALILTPLARGEKGNTNWIYIPGAGQTIQPSEFLKLALAVWLGLVLARKAHLLHRWQHILVPGLAVAVLALGLVLVGRDLGTAMVVALVVAGAMFVAGIPLKWFGAALVGAAAVVSFLVISSPNRMQRIVAVFGGECDESAACYQTLHGLYGLGTGGISGLGLGASREKWAYLPEAHNDYIFAILGEELGLWGTLLVLGLFAALATGMFRIVRRHPDPFVKITTGAIAAWILGQALINIGVVIGFLPVIGVPLPLVSAGGSALIATLLAMGVVLAFARDEPGAGAALRARRGVVRRSLAVVGRGRG
ncbi:putative lipid II flippase FtsW [Georgenia satyanarayanai]|uniref:putative lipid II flippase FtsW n=1 Tax=Georgenia satyanarayanai TaxID=860221 RepID=UPI0029C9C865|nr:putative lipid II flippase FtsW [Georgenia satyanarayanai]